ncbi:MAG TPA: zinc transporter ZntB, partial [Alphaproteobacteria bacterium]|nr:zinc transporter ZntB [Alphaproteobacteria bacterium]
MSAIPDKHIVHALLLDGAGGAQALDVDEIPARIAAGEPVWVHLEAVHPDTPQWLGQHLPILDALMIDALVAEETRPRAIEHDNTILLFLRGVNLNENAEPEDMVSIRMCIGEKFCVSLRRRPLKAVSDIVQRLQRGNGPGAIPDLVNDLAGTLFDRMEPVLSELDERTDNLEELVADKPDAAIRHEIVSLRKRAILLRRYLAPQRDAIGRLR